MSQESSNAALGIVVEPSHNPAASTSTGRGKGCHTRRDLYIAALGGNWRFAKALVDKDHSLLCNSEFPPEEDTILHVATSANRITFVKEFVKAFTIDLTLQNKNGDMALSIAAALGFLDIAQIMIEKNDKLPDLTNNNKETPLLMAVRGRQKEMALYLFPRTHFDKLAVPQRNTLFVAMVIGEMYEIALQMLDKDPSLAQNQLKALRVLARRPQDISIGSGVKTTIRYICSWIYKEALKPTLAYELLKKIWKLVLELEDERILELIQKTPDVLFLAVKSGNVEFLALLLESFPRLVWEVDEEHKGLLHAAILHRQEKIFHLIYNLGIFKGYIITHIDDGGDSHKKNKKEDDDGDCHKKKKKKDDDGDCHKKNDDGDSHKKKDGNMLHLAGKLPPDEFLDTSRPNLQMQRELSWFKEVQKIVSPAFTKQKNKKGLTPKDLFWKEHKELHIKARTAMKETADSCMLVSTLISTIVFAAALTVPGSSNSGAQTRIFHRDTWFMIFVVANAVALFSSSTSIIMLLSILTSRQSSFENSRAKMICGLTTLFISITTMVIAFAAAVFLMFDHKSTWVPYFTASLASVPVISFLLLHYKLVMGRI